MVLSVRRATLSSGDDDSMASTEFVAGVYAAWESGSVVSGVNGMRGYSESYARGMMGAGGVVVSSPSGHRYAESSPTSLMLL